MNAMCDHMDVVRDYAVLKQNNVDCKNKNKNKKKKNTHTNKLSKRSFSNDHGNWIRLTQWFAHK